MLTGVNHRAEHRSAGRFRVRQLDEDVADLRVSASGEPGEVRAGVSSAGNDRRLFGGKWFLGHESIKPHEGLDYSENLAKPIVVSRHAVRYTDATHHM